MDFSATQQTYILCLNMHKAEIFTLLLKNNLIKD